MSTSVDVVIVTRNRYERTAGCLRHLAGQTIGHRAIVVDNGSTDDTPSRLRADWPDVRLVALDRNHGVAVGANRGVAAGSAEIVVLLNDEVRCRADFLERLLAPFQDTSVGSVAALVLQPREERIDSVGLTADVTLAGFPRLHGLPVARARDPRPVLTGPAGTAAAYRREAWEGLGGLDEAIFTYMEDLDLALRLRSAGWKPAAAPDAVGVNVRSTTHKHRLSSRRELRTGLCAASLRAAERLSHGALTAVGRRVM